ncbi:MAG: hypothetical protein HKN16_05435, partial [Saprospiraceae bacterium]|nr:hypothetical protein [Saprospiraceae bacterium]
DTIHVHVNFDEAQMDVVHHVNVRMYKNGDESLVLFDAPSMAHVHEMSGHYEVHGDVILDVDGNTDWVLEAKVWGHDAGLGETILSREFHVHPM